MKILFIGQNPSNKAPNSAFIGTSSGKRLLSWILEAKIPLDIVSFSNVSDEASENNSPIPTAELKKIASSELFMRKISGYNIIFTCGKQASIAVSHALASNSSDKAMMVELPHPSGLNRKLNDRLFVREVISKIRDSYESKAKEQMEEPVYGADL